VQRNSAMSRPPSSVLARASQICVVRPLCARRHAGDAASARRAQEVARERERREPHGARRQTRQRPIATRCVGQGDDGRRVQIAVESTMCVTSSGRPAIGNPLDHASIVSIYAAQVLNPWSRRNGLELRQLVRELLPGKNVRRRASVLGHRRSRLAKVRLVQTPPHTKYRALLGRSTALGADRLSDGRPHDPPCHARDRPSRRLDTPHKWHVRG